MGVVQRNREVSRIREAPLDDELIQWVDLKVSLEICGVQIAKIVIASPFPKGDGVAGVIEVTEKVTGRKLVPGERSRKAGTIDRIRDARK